MARSSKRRAPRFKKQRYDWVYRGNEWEPEGGAAATGQGTYRNDFTTLVGGAINAESFPLYDSQNYTAQSFVMNASSAFVNQISRAGRAEGRGPLIKAVDGELHVSPSTWAVGQQMRWGWRIIIAEQDPDDGKAMVDADYSMFLPTIVAPDTDIVIYRNDPQTLAEGFVFRGFSDNGAQMRVPIRWKGRPRRLGALHGLFLYLESESIIGTTVNPLIRPRLRTLVADES